MCQGMLISTSEHMPRLQYISCERRGRGWNRGEGEGMVRFLGEGGSGVYSISLALPGSHHSHPPPPALLPLLPMRRRRRRRGRIWNS